KRLYYRGRGNASTRCAERRLVGALLRLVGLERLGRIDVAERGMARDEALRRRDAEALRQHRAERLHLHLAEARQRLDAAPEVVRVLRLRPQPRGVAVVLARDRA